jgi:hypothetical protein
VCAEREKRLDIEEVIAEQRKLRDTLTKELEMLTKRSKVVEAMVLTAEEELEAFQASEKMK